MTVIHISQQLCECFYQIACRFLIHPMRLRSDALNLLKRSAVLVGAIDLIVPRVLGSGRVFVSCIWIDRFVDDDAGYCHEYEANEHL